MLHAHLVAIHELAAEIAIDLVQVHAVVARQEGFHELQVLADFVNVAGAARIVSRSLDTARQGTVVFETGNVIGLPAMQGNLLFLQFGNGLVGIYADGSIAFLGQLIRFEDICFFHIA